MQKMKIFALLLSNVYTPKSDKETFSEIPLSILVDGQLIGHPDSKERRTDWVNY